MVNPKIEAKPAAKKAMPIANDEFEDHFVDDAADEQSENGFNKLSGDDLFDLFNKE